MVVNVVSQISMKRGGQWLDVSFQLEEDGEHLWAGEAVEAGRGGVQLGRFPPHRFFASITKAAISGQTEKINIFIY